MEVRKFFQVNRLLWLLLFVYPLIPGLDASFQSVAGLSLGAQLRDMFVFAILALGLNVVVGYSGLLQLGIAAFFGIGAYLTGILTVETNPFQIGFWGAILASFVGTGLAGVVLGAPVLRLRGDYLAIVTLGFAEVVRFAMINLEELTNGPRGINPIPAPELWIVQPDWGQDYRAFYWLTLTILGLVVLTLKNLENSRLGRTWLAIREDELAAACMGINPAKAKLSAFALGSSLAGVAGCLYATTLTTTASPNAYDFNRSVTVLCFLIIGGMGSIGGALLGTFVLMGFDNVLTPILNTQWQKAFPEATISMSDLRYILFGLALILMMRFRPEGLLPSWRVREELKRIREEG